MGSQLLVQMVASLTTISTANAPGIASATMMANNVCNLRDSTNDETCYVVHLRLDAGEGCVVDAIISE